MRVGFLIMGTLKSLYFAVDSTQYIHGRIMCLYFRVVYNHRMSLQFNTFLPWRTYRPHITMTSLWARWRLKSPTSRLFTQLFSRRRSQKTSKLRITGLCEGNSPVTGEFPTQRASNAEMLPCDDVIMQETILSTKNTVRFCNYQNTLAK